MTDARSPSAQLIRFRPKPDQLLRLIRKLAGEGNVGYLAHALLERMPERGFDTQDVDHVLRTGVIAGPIDSGKNPGEWKVKIVSWLDGTSRKMGVVVIVVREAREPSYAKILRPLLMADQKGALLNCGLMAVPSMHKSALDAEQKAFFDGFIKRS